MLRQLICLVVAAAGCLVPVAWVCVPAAAYLLFWVPGRAAVRLLRPLDSSPGRGWLTLALSLLIAPLLLGVVWEFTIARPAVLGALVLMDAILLVLAHLFGSRVLLVSRLFDNPRQKYIFTAVVIWTAGLVFCVYYLPMAGHRLVSNPSGDYIKHHAIVWSLTSYTLPVHNIFYAAESSTPYFYYELFYLLPAALCVISGGTLSISAAFGIAAALAAISFVGMVLLLARTIIGNMRGAVLAVVCASIVGGLDIVPTLLYCVKLGRPVVILDVWCPVFWRVHNLMNNYVWCPQHVAATGLLLLSAVLLQQAPRAAWWLVLAPLAAVAIFGTSVYQAMVFFPAAMLWALLEWSGARNDPRRFAGRLLLVFVAIAIFGGALMLPRALHYAAMNARFEGGLTLQWPRFEYALLGRCVPAGPLANLLDAPWMLLVDFGIGAIAAVSVGGIVWRRFWRDPGGRLLLLAGGLGVALMWVVRSNVNRYDYGFRLASMPAMVVTAIMVGFLLQPEYLRPFVRKCSGGLLAGGLVLGSAVGLYETPGLAFRTLFESKSELVEAGALRYLRNNLPAGAVVQGRPDRYELPQLIDRQIGVLDPENSHVNVLCPLDRSKMIRAVADVQAAFESADPVEARKLFVRWGITHVLVGPAERARYGNLSQLRDPSCFQIVYDDGRAAVFRVRGVADSQPEKSGASNE